MGEIDQTLANGLSSARSEASVLLGSLTRAWTLTVYAKDRSDVLQAELREAARCLAGINALAERLGIAPQGDNVRVLRFPSRKGNDGGAA